MRIAIVKLSALGDIVHAMVVLQFIKKHNKEILIDWFVEESYKELLEFHPDIDKVHIVKIKKVKQNKSLPLLFKELNKLRKLKYYDLVVDMQGLFKSAIISKLIPSKNTVGFDKFSIREKLASSFYDLHFNIGYDQNIIKRNFELVKFATNFPFKINEINKKSPFIYSKQEFSNENLSSTKKNILLIPGASNISKRYPPDCYAQIPYLLTANYLILWGTSKEKSIAKEIKKLAPNVIICSKLSLSKLVSLISKVDLVIGSDTGPTHIAWALNIPPITLFGSTPGYRNTFETEINKIIESKSKVNPNKINRNDYSIRSILSNDIVKIARYLI